MAKYNHTAIAELSHQLTLSPVRLRLLQLDAAEHLVSIMDADMSYPYEFILHQLTGYRPKEMPKYRPMRGKTLIEDLAMLTEDLSSDRPLPAGILQMRCWTTEELSQRLKVSTKTIGRWRRRGLVGRRMRFADGTARMGFSERSVRRFVTAHKELVQRGAAFKQLTNAEKDQIVTLARELLSERRIRLHELSQILAERVDRAVETIRYTLRKYDEANPEQALFSGDEQPTIQPEFKAIYDAVRAGESLEAAGTRFGHSVEMVKAIIREVRARLIIAAELDCISGPEFDAPNADDVILNATSDPETTPRKRIRPPKDLPPYLQELYRQPLFSPEQERDIFRRYNYLKFKADRMRKDLDPLNADEAVMTKIEHLQAEAERVKNEILKANLRLVVSIARRHVGRHPHFFEIVSDGNLSLMRAVEKFDYARGFKFSTYASWAIMRNFARTIPEHMYASARTVTGVDEVLSAAPAREEIVSEVENDGMRQIISRGLGLLTARERDVVSKHYGLEKESTPMTLDQIGKVFGVTKERIRQIERRALTKLREALGGYEKDFASD